MTLRLRVSLEHDNDPDTTRIKVEADEVLTANLRAIAIREKCTIAEVLARQILATLELDA